MNPKLLILAAAIALAVTQPASAATWQWTGNASTGDWQTAANWGNSTLNTSFNGTFADRLNVNSPQALIYTSAEGVTVYGSNATRGLAVGSGNGTAGQSGNMVITGGTFSTLNATGSNGDVIGNGNNTTGILTVNGGNFIGATAGTNIGIGAGTGRVSTLNVQAGTATITTLNLNSTLATVNLSGTGVLEVNSISRTVGTTGNINFNGGTLKARAASAIFLTGLTTATVNGGGIAVDSSGFDITVGQSLLAGAGSGGLTKLGSGTLTLNGTNTYNGTTTITGGTLKIGAAERIADASNVSMASGATLNANGFSETLGTLVLTGSATLDLGAGGSNTLAFANSSALDWSTFTLTINNWSGTNFLKFGTDSTGLTAGQLANINFTGFGTGAAIDASGFVTAIPEPGTWIMVGIGLTFLLYRRRSSRLSDKDF